MIRAVATLLIFWSLGSRAPAATPDSCISCHAQLEGKLAEPVKLYEGDVHHQAGLTCADCHGGNRSDESMDAMSPAQGFRGAPKRTQIPQFCARCHSDAGYMRRFNPSLRTDQLSEYWTSVHGKRLRQGDAWVATCVDCHSVHNILAVSDSRAPVYPANVAGTCAHCHADAASMGVYHIPTNQFALYQKSVHAAALANGDTSAPTCSTCHGNHGATPPGIASVSSVCGTCHVMNQQLFEKSPHQAAFAKNGWPGCVQCHSNHDIVKPSDDWIGAGENSTCTNCHLPGDAGYRVSKQMAADLAHLRALHREAVDIVDTAERSGMEVSSARVELTDAQGELIKGRVNIHSFNPAEVGKDTGQGIEIAQKAIEAGRAALRERDFRRKGLGLSLIFIAMAIAGLYLKVRAIETRSKDRKES